MCLAKWTAGFFVMLLSAVMIQAEIKTQEIEYKDGKTVLRGYVAYDSDEDDLRPGILIIHPWKGHGDYVRRRARQLAQMGYVAFALDMYGKGVYAKDHKEAAKLSGLYKSDRSLMRSRVKAGLAQLKKQPFVQEDKIALIGYCFGGATVLEMALSGLDVRGVVSFHGTFDRPKSEKVKPVKAKVLILHGADDSYTSEETKVQLKKDLDQGGADWQMVEYSGVVHSFTVVEAGNDPSKGSAYNATADQRSWLAMENFFDEIF